MMKKITVFLYPVLNILILVNCVNLNTKAASKSKPEENILTLTFSGDIMAHDVNFNMKDYNKIYEEVLTLLHSDDFTFANVETPVCDTLPMFTYPRFNVHSSYLEAAVKGGFDVFSFANNHTNDQSIEGIDGTLKSVSAIQTSYLEKKRKIYYSGLHEKDFSEMKAEIITHGNWKILFLAVSEITNSYDESVKRFYYSPPVSKKRTELLNKIKEMREKNPCDLFILSLHLYEKEYGLSVEASKREWFKRLAENGADIVWAHHPHVMQEWETVEISDGRKAFFMYSMGNFISGQRNKINGRSPEHFREYTGDAVLIRLEVTKAAGTMEYGIKPILVTCYKSAEGLVIKPFTESWIETLNAAERQYFKKRMELMKAYLPIGGHTE